MSGLAMLVHCPNSSGKKELGTRGERVHIGGRQHRNAAWRQKAADVPQEANGALNMLYDFNGCNEAKGRGAELRGKVRLVEIKRNVRNACFETAGVAVNGHDIASNRLQTGGHCAGPRAKINRTHARTRVTLQNSVADKLVKSAVGRGSNHQVFPADCTPK